MRVYTLIIPGHKYFYLDVTPLRDRERIMIQKPTADPPSRTSAWQVVEGWELKRRRRSILRPSIWWNILFAMSGTEVIEQFKALPASERAQVVKFVVENDDS